MRASVPRCLSVPTGSLSKPAKVQQWHHWTTAAGDPFVLIEDPAALHRHDTGSPSLPFDGWLVKDESDLREAATVAGDIRVSNHCYLEQDLEAHRGCPPRLGRWSVDHGRSLTLRLLYWGTPAYAVPTLSALHAAGHTIVGVVTQPDRRRGRGKQLVPSPVKQRAIELGCPVFTPERIRRDDDCQQQPRTRTRRICGGGLWSDSSG